MKNSTPGLATCCMILNELLSFKGFICKFWEIKAVLPPSYGGSTLSGQHSILGPVQEKILKSFVVLSC